MKRIVLLFVIFFISTANAWENDYGSVRAWVKLKGGEWEEATLDGITLKVGEPFRVRAEIMAKINCSAIVINVYDPGVTKVFEVIKGESKNEEMIVIQNVSAGWKKTYEWVVRPTGKWKNGWAAWNIWVAFGKNLEDREMIDKTIVWAYISSEEWNREETGFEFIFLIPIFLIFLKMNRKGIFFLPFRFLISIIIIAVIISILIAGFGKMQLFFEEQKMEKHVNNMILIFNEMINGDARNLGGDFTYGERRQYVLDLPPHLEYIGIGVDPDANDTGLTGDGNIIVYKIAGRSKRVYWMDDEIKLRAGEYRNGKWLAKIPSQGLIMRHGKHKLIFELVKYNDEKFILVYSMP